MRVTRLSETRFMVFNSLLNNPFYEENIQELKASLVEPVKQ